LRVVLRPPSAEELAAGHKSDHAFCVATSRVEPNDSVREIFKQIASNQILHGEPHEPRVTLEYTAPDGARIRLPALVDFSKPFKSFLEGVRDELADYARRSVSVLRWRVNELGPHNPISSRGMRWSFDGVSWHPAPSDLGGRLRILSPVRTSASTSAEVAALVEAGESGPLYHDLFREAWEQCDSNPRSALVIGIAAAELGIKRCIGTLIPGAEWLAICRFSSSVQNKEWLLDAFRRLRDFYSSAAAQGRAIITCFVWSAAFLGEPGRNRSVIDARR
jgi:hypothetical protein